MNSHAGNIGRINELDQWHTMAIILLLSHLFLGQQALFTAAIFTSNCMVNTGVTLIMALLHLVGPELWYYQRYSDIERYYKYLEDTTVERQCVLPVS